MDKSSRLDIPLEAQRDSWNRWNADTARESKLGEPSRRQAELIESWLEQHGRPDMRLLDAGCGTGWMSERMKRFGEVTAIDLADAVIEQARRRVPGVTFLVGDLSSEELGTESFDVVVSLEVLSHIVDKSAFLGRIASALRPSGLLMLATQNRPVLERCSDIGGPIEGQVRRWVGADELRALVRPFFEVEELTSVLPVGDQGLHRWLNSRKLNRMLATFVGSENLLRFKERTLLAGHTLMVRARKRGGQRA